LLLVAFPPARDGFSHLVNSILSAAGQPVDGPAWGQHLFRFWEQ